MGINQQKKYCSDLNKTEFARSIYSVVPIYLANKIGESKKLKRVFGFILFSLNSLQ